MSTLAPPPPTVIGAGDIAAATDRHRTELVEVARAAYLTHDAGDSANPHSSFLRFPHQERSRIISLPAYLGGAFEVAGNKWIASFPDNTRHGVPRASATLILNDCVSGYPFACVESSIVSATRTAASAVLGAQTLLGTRRARRVGIVGTGLIAQHVWRFLRDLDWEIDAFRLFDLDPAAVGRFAAAVAKDTEAEPVVAEKVEEAFTDCDLVVLTTVAGEPHLHDPQLLAHNPVVLHLSLRDLAPEMILAARNFTDDVDHAVRERTSLHLTEERTGNRDFIDGTLADLLCERLRRDHGRPAIFSPFGLGVLDLAVGKWVHDRFP
ncbi:2,3-diaminopropionate biosynthesis protein SbnB [Streptomyces malaysiensis subsp. malaysiensis]|uniref:2,3-diaminopropionate biosynthesis protein SbnB n=1 Tax=Streptomyces malaysiensis TaxID=92644 RepID=A0ABX6WL33_STRMQ|nr:MULTISPECIES: 2,3-diaminopropionate biosynthesis protein SbnB [Streptomyces]QPI61264.1 2,3-diaminopropionate biosynthesis protein SbnB [Streptomyces solisilvae]UHH23027.1 2,3-diaminopropionate biosynthesis protein SbnB [Streptomyces sp. HNM0561]